MRPALSSRLPPRQRSIGGLGVEAHDGFNILWRLGALEHTALIASTMVALASLTWALMLAAPRWVG